jgi:hypothetical protein
MPDKFMKEAIKKLQTSKKWAEARKRQREREQRIKEEEGLVVWNRLVEWMDECRTLYKPENDLKFNKTNEHEFSLVFNGAYPTQTERVTFDAHRATIEWCITSSSVFANAITEHFPGDNYQGSFEPTLTGDTLVYLRGGNKVSVPQMGKILIELLAAAVAPA